MAVPGIPTGTHKALLSIRAGEAATGCCNVRAGYDARLAPVANLAAKPADDWTRGLVELLPALNACAARNAATFRAVTRRPCPGHQRARAPEADRRQGRRLRGECDRPWNAHVDPRDRGARRRRARGGIRRAIPRRSWPAAGSSARRTRAAPPPAISNTIHAEDDVSPGWLLACDRARAGGAAQAQVPPIGGRGQGLQADSSPPPTKVTWPRSPGSRRPWRKIDARDARGRTPLIVAAFARQRDAMRALVAAAPIPTRSTPTATTWSPSPRSPMTSPPSRSPSRSATRPTNVTSRYDGTALIAAAHLGHAEVVRTLIARRCAARPRQQPRLDRAHRVDRAGRRRTAAHRHADDLVQRGADVNLPDRTGLTPLHLAQANGYREMATVLEAAGGR